MSSPVFRPLNLGDTADDDAQVIDSLVETVDAPPTPVVEPIVTPALIDPPVPTRLLSTHQNVDPAWSGATQLFPADLNRQRFHIKVTSLTAVATDGAVLMSEAKSPVGLGTLLHGKTLDLDGHTGAVWVIATGSAVVSVDAWCVTK